MINRPTKITVATSLTGKGAEDPKFFEPHGCLQTVMDSPAPGMVRFLMLGSEGLQIRHADHLVVIPKELLLTLAEKLDPAMVPPAPQVQKTNAALNAKLIPDEPPATAAVPDNAKSEVRP